MTFPRCVKFIILPLFLLGILLVGCRSHAPSKNIGDEERKKLFEEVFGPNNPIMMTEQDIQISEAVFMRMFSEGSGLFLNDKHRYNRYIRIGNRTPDEFLDELIETLRKNTDFDILPNEGDGGEWGGKFPLYSINSIELLDDNTAKVWCAITWGGLASRGYIYELRYANSRWWVVAVTSTWMS